MITTDTATLETLESIIRDHAGNIVGLVRQREAHPSHGITKASIRAKEQRMEGVIAAYMVLTGQALHAFAPQHVVVFSGSNRVDTAGAINDARDALRTL